MRTVRKKDITMRFSVITCVYNDEMYLKECIYSVINQTYKSIELIIVDDGSDDNSGCICDEFQKKFPEYIKVIHTENQGPLLGRRTGFRESSGEYILIIDSDDVLRNNALEMIDKIINKEKYDMVIFDYSLNSEFERYNRSCINLKEQSSDLQHLYKDIMQLENNFLWNKCFRRETFDENQDYSKLNLITKMNDLYQLLPIVDNCKEYYYLKEALYYHRKNIKSITNSYNISDFDSVKRVLNKVKLYSVRWKQEANVSETQAIMCIVKLRGIRHSNTTFLERLKEYLQIVNDDLFIEAMERGWFKQRRVKTRMYLFFILVQVRIYEKHTRVKL